MKIVFSFTIYNYEGHNDNLKICKYIINFNLNSYY